MKIKRMITSTMLGLAMFPAAAFAILAFFIGNAGGAVSAMNVGRSQGASMISIRQFAALQEFKGIASYSLAATYLKATESGTSE